MAITVKMLGLNIRTEVHSAAGRCDMQIHTDPFIYIFEFKINGSAKDALQQIHDRQYMAPFSTGRRTIFLIGANFSIQDRNISDWIIETV